MKKIFTLILSAFVAVAASAQIVMLDPNGNEYTVGQEMAIYADVDPDWGDVSFIGLSPVLKNKGTKTVNVSMGVNIVSLPEGTGVSDCFSGGCVNYYATGEHTTMAKPLAAGSEMHSEVEWSCWSQAAFDYVHGVCTVDFTIYENGTSTGIIRVNYIYADPAAVETVKSADNLKVVESYTLNGQRATAGSKGVILNRMSDGRVVKVMR